MASNSTGVPTASHKEQYDAHFTESVINAIGPNATPRVRQVTTSFIRHLHDFARENDITVDEFMAGLELVDAPLIAFEDGVVVDVARNR